MGFVRWIILMRSRLDLDDWRLWLRDFQLAPLEFYGLLEAAIRARRIPDLEISHQEHQEASLLSDRRVYLRLRRDRFLFDCCAAPFGADYFFSWWLWIMPRRFTLLHFLGLLNMVGLLNFLSTLSLGFFDGVMAVATILYLIFLINQTSLIRRAHWIEEYLYGLSVLGVIWELFFRKPTCFEMDTAQVFMASIHDCCLTVLDGLTQTHSLRTLTEKERERPVMRDFFHK